MEIRIATTDDIPALRRVMEAAIGELMNPYLDPAQVEASREFMGLDTQLVKDGTYFAVEEDGAIMGCGGWSMRATLFGGDHSAGRNEAMLDPEKDAARVRAMYTDPKFVRRGVGRLVLKTCEEAAREHGFKRAELVATLAGEPLYAACGYRPVRRFAETASNGVEVPLILMEKSL